MVSQSGIRVAFLCALLAAGMVDARRVKKKAASAKQEMQFTEDEIEAVSAKVVKKHVQSKEKAPKSIITWGSDGDWDSCAHVAAEVRAIAGASVQDGETTIVTEEWEGVYKCLQTEGKSANTIMFIGCGMIGPQDDIEEKSPLFGTAQCWERSRADDLQQFTHVAGQQMKEAWSGITGWLSSKGGDDSEEDQAAFLSSLLPTGPSEEELRQAITAFATNTENPEAEAELTAELIDSGRWKTLNPFERAFTVQVLLSAGPSGASALQISESESSSRQQQGKEIEAFKQSTGDNWFVVFLRIIAKLFENGRRNRARAAQNRYMDMNIGWGHVRSNMRRDGWRMW